MQQVDNSLDQTFFDHDLQAVGFGWADSTGWIAKSPNVAVQFSRPPPSTKRTSVWDATATAISWFTLTSAEDSDTEFAETFPTFRLADSGGPGNRTLRACLRLNRFQTVTANQYSPALPVAEHAQK